MTEGKEALRGLFPSLEELLRAISTLSGRNQGDLEEELSSHLRLRLLFLLLGLAEGASNFAVIERRIQRGLELDRDSAQSVARVISVLLANVAGADVSGRQGISSITYLQRGRLLRRQGGRCAICGRMFSHSDEERLSLDEMTLDHRIPFRLGGDDESNLQILCRRCNAVKRHYLHVGESGSVWMNNHVYWSNRRVVAFWVLVRDGACQRHSCGRGPDVSSLSAGRRSDAGPWSFDNCIALCDSHAAEYEVIRY
jgi:hypothetical protein